MNYQQTLAKIHAFDKFGTRLGLERVSDLLRRLGNPQRDLAFVHVAGTNGKGSVSKMLAEIFSAQGKKVGLYTSPYVIDFRERMQIDGEMIAEEALCAVAEKVFREVEQMEDTPTEFELITAMAMLYFKEAQCDLVVLEVGLGGIYDATNVIDTPLLSVITSVSFDHTEYLGDTLASIAENKAGIIKPGGKTVLAYGQAPEVIDVIRKKAEKEKNSLLVCRNKTRSYNGKAFMYEDKLYELSMLGFHQLQNAVTAIESAKMLGASDAAVFKGIKAARLPARMELVSRNPAVIIDGAHNAEAMDYLCKNIRHFFSDKKIVAITAMMADKEWKESLLKLESVTDEIIAVKASNPRSLPPEDIAAFLHCAYEADAKKAFLGAMDAADNNTLILVCGSLYLAGDLRSFILQSTT
ncbi:MAG: bifunctional folylpolyglutamate synthase/dihydrofolate synthase [Ruminococcaceae bacterium]|nr:bifunctional folylpolyglutamate synthase/dihydrofolate synthase [Oscillospiraceae bacterium]